MNPGTLVWTVVGFLLTVMVLSYLIGDNFLFRLAAYLFVGLTAGYLAVLLINQVLWPHLVQPLATGNWPGVLWLVIPAVFALLLLLGQIPKLSSLARIPLAFLVGLTAAVAIGGAVFGTLVPQAQAVIEGFDPAHWYTVPEQTWLRIADAIVMLLGTVSVLSYFHFGGKLKPKKIEDEHKRPVVLEGLSKIGQVFLGIVLGAVFAGVFSTALLALIDRLAFLGEAIQQFMGGL
jgi:hypothetical protein